MDVWMFIVGSLMLLVGVIIGWIARGFDVTKVIFYDSARVNGDLLPTKRILFIPVKSSGTPVDSCFHEVTYG